MDRHGRGSDEEVRTDDTDLYHRETDDPRDWDDDAFAVTGPVEAHGRGVDFGLFLLRLSSLSLVLHGVHKALDMDAFTTAVSGTVVGDSAPDVVAWLVVVAQIGLPVLLVLGLFTRPAAFLLAGLMAGIWTLGVVLEPGYTVLGPHGELTGESALLYLALALPLVFTGAGRWSADSLRTGGRP